MKTALVAASLLAMALPANAASLSFDQRVTAFYSSIVEKPGEELNCFPAVCHAKAHHFGLTFMDRNFAVCDEHNPRRCGIPD